MNQTNSKTKQQLNKKEPTKEELARRLAQSKRDKKIAKSGTSNTQSNTAKKSVPLLNSLVKHELDLDVSVAHSIQTLFMPRDGVHRPYSGGYEETALVVWESTFTIAGFTNTNNAVTAYFAPFWTAAVDQVSYVTCPSTGLLNPITTGTALAISGPFYSNSPAQQCRTISFEIILTPVGPNQTLAGAGCISYFPKGGQSMTWNDAQGKFEKQKYVKTFSGSDKIIAHWLPNQEERSINPVSGTSVNSDSGLSGIGMYYIAPTGVAANESIRVDIVQVIEYVPNATYYPYVSLKASEGLPNTDHYVAKTFTQKADPLVFGTYADWRAVRDSMTLYAGHTHGAIHAPTHVARDDIEGVYREQSIPDARDVHPGMQPDSDSEDEEFKQQPQGQYTAEKIREGLSVPSLVQGVNTIVETGTNVASALGGNPIPLLTQVVKNLAATESLDVID